MLMQLDRAVSVSFALVLHCYAKRLSHKTRAICHPITSRTKNNRNFSRALLQLHVSAPRFDWFAGLSVQFAIGQSDHFGFRLVRRA